MFEWFYSNNLTAPLWLPCNKKWPPIEIISHNTFLLFIHARPLQEEKKCERTVINLKKEKGRDLFPVVPFNTLKKKKKGIGHFRQPSGEIDSHWSIFPYYHGHRVQSPLSRASANKFCSAGSFKPLKRTLTAWRHSRRCTSFSLHLGIFSLSLSLSVTFWTSFIYKNRIVAKTIYGH